MFNEVKTVFIDAAAGVSVAVETQVNKGLQRFTLVGLPDRSVAEAKDRVQGALINANLPLPYGQITVNLTPAYLPKGGTSCDLAITAGLMLASGAFGKPEVAEFKDYTFIGEVTLGGMVVVPDNWATLICKLEQLGVNNVVGPKLPATPKSLDYNVIESLTELYRWLKLSSAERISNKYLQCKTKKISNLIRQRIGNKVDSKQVEKLLALKANPIAERIVLIAASGAHSVLLDGTPGTGKTTYLANVHQLCPDLNDEQLWELESTYQLSGSQLRSLKPPLRSPHHSASLASILGGGATLRPGEVSLAHYGFLFLDEISEFSREVLESLRQPLLDREVQVSRVKYRARLPARFTLLATRNGCPCGWYGDPSGKCNCPVHIVERYQRKVSGAILDRIDLKYRFDRPMGGFSSNHTPSAHNDSAAGLEYLADLRDIVAKARARQYLRFGEKMLNSDYTNPFDLDILQLASDVTLEVRSQKHLSYRSHFQLVKVARTIADIDASAYVEMKHFLEAVNYTTGGN